jgi:hypothetical protein
MLMVIESDVKIFIPRAVVVEHLHPFFPKDVVIHASPAPLPMDPKKAFPSAGGLWRL